MISDIQMDNDLHSFDDMRSPPIRGNSTLTVNMVFRGVPSLVAVFMEAQNMSEADGLRHIAAALDALSGPTHTPGLSPSDHNLEPLPHRTLPDNPPEPEPRERSTGRRNLQIE